MAREDRINKAFAVMTDEELESTLERASDVKENKTQELEEKEERVRSGPAEDSEDLQEMLDARKESAELRETVNKAQEEIERVESEKQWRQFPSSIQAETDLDRYMHEIGLGEFAEGMNDEYRELIKEPLQQGRDPNVVIAAAVRDRYWKKHKNLEEELDVTQGSITSTLRELGLEVFNADYLRKQIDEYREEFGEDEAELIEQYSKELPNARPEEMAAVVAVAQTPEYAETSVEEVAEYFGADPEKVERAAEYFEQERGQEL